MHYVFCILTFAPQGDACGAIPPWGYGLFHFYYFYYRVLAVEAVGGETTDYTD